MSVFSTTDSHIYGKEIGSNKQTTDIDTVLLCKINPRINRVWIVGNFSSHRKIASTEWIPFEHISGIDPRYLCYFMQQTSFRDFLAANVAGIGGSLMRIKPSVFENYPFPIAPLSEQQRIINEIETQSTRLDSVIANLSRLKLSIEKLRDHTIKAACEGRLVPTESTLAESEGRDFETGEQLLIRIFNNRRSIWESNEISKITKKDKTPKDGKWKSKYGEPFITEISDLQELPKGWSWTNLSTIADLKSGITKGQKRKPEDRLRSVPYLRVANVQRGFLDLSEIKSIDATEDEIKNYKLIYNDILFTEGGDRDKLGRGWIWQEQIPECIHQNHIFRARLFTPELQPKFISWYANFVGKEYFIRQGKQTTNLASINLTKLRAFPVPLPPVSEQQRIVAEVERRLSVLDKVMSLIDVNIKRAETLKEKILKYAFEGKLVAQDPSDESGEKLLERIIAEKLRLESVKASKIKRPKKKSSVTRKSEGQFSLPFETSKSKRPEAFESPRIRNMKLISLKIDGEYKSLYNFEQIFRRGSREDSTLSPICLVGLNGSGKSNLIEALSEIFCYLEIINLPYEKITRKYRQNELRFEIEYELPLEGSKSARRIRISKMSGSQPVFTEIIDDDEKEIDEEYQLDALPTRIIGYSSGLNETISIPFFRNKSVYSKEVAERAFTERESKKKQLDLPPVVNTRTFFMDYDSNAAILLANYLFSSKDKLKVFRNYLRINDIASFQITIQLFYRSNMQVELTSELKDSIASLKRCATETINEDGENRFTFTYNVTPKTRKAFRQEFGNAKNLFTALYKLSLLNFLALTGPERKLYWREDVKEGLVERPPIVPKEQKILI